MPRVFVVQLMFIYRYVFVLMQEVGRMSRARKLRAVNGRGLDLASFASAMGHLSLRI